MASENRQASSAFTRPSIQITTICVIATLSSLNPFFANEGRSPSEVGRMESQVYAVVLQAKEADRALMIVQADTGTRPCQYVDLGELISRDIIASLVPQLMASPKGSVRIFSSPAAGSFVLPRETIRELNRDFESRNRVSRRIEFQLPRSSAVRFVPKAALDRIFGPDDLRTGWKRFHTTYGESAELLRFSRAGFDESRTIAIVHVDSAIDAMAGEGRLYLLGYAKHKWSILRSYSTWVT